jgi:chemotaxis protein histidine kinase CheA
MFKSERDLEGDFFDFIGKYVAPNTVQTAREYLGLLYGERVKEKLVKDLNPLNEVQINIVRRDGSYENRYLNFQFNRVIENEKLSHILVSVTDETRRVLLERELAETKEEQEAQIDLLMSILHVDNSQLTTFLEAADTDLREVNKTLEARGHKDTDIRLKIDSIARTVHKLKGDASALALHRFEFSAHAFEEELVAVKANSGALTGKELLPALTKLKDLFGELHQMESIVAKLGDHAASDLVGNNNDTMEAKTASSVPQAVSNGISKALFDLTESVSERNGKRAHLNVYGLDEDDLSLSMSPERQSDLQSIAVQLVRNSIVHGALLPGERLAKGKSDFINITTSLSNTEDAHVLIVKDDGEGFDNQKIIDRAVELELFTAAQLSKLNPEHAFKLIFQPGFTSIDEANLDGGRGVGLDVVHSMVKKLGGAVAVQHKMGLYCQFKITIPK